MRPRERRETSEQDPFRSRLDQIIDMTHALVKLARAIDSSLNRRLPESGEGLSLRRLISQGRQYLKYRSRVRSYRLQRPPMPRCALRPLLMWRLAQCTCRRSSSLRFAKGERRG